MVRVKEINLDDDGMDANNTQIVGEQEQPKRRRSTNSKTAQQKDIIATKLNLLCDVVFSLLGYEYCYTEDDFKKESTAFANLCKDYGVVNNVFALLDPIMIIGSMWQKVKGMKKRPKEAKQNVPRETQQKPVDNVPRETQAQNLFSFQGRVING